MSAATAEQLGVSDSDSEGATPDPAAMEAEFEAALHSELTEAMQALDRIDGNDPLALSVAIRRALTTAGERPTLRLLTRVSIIERLSERMHHRMATQAVNAVFAEIEPPRIAAADESVTGSIITYDADEPAEEPVELGDLLDDLTAFITLRVHLCAEAIHAIAVWLVHTYLAECVRITPYLAVTSPVKQCGKSTLIDVLAMLAYRAQPAASATPAVLFRLMELFRPTLMIDEADRWLCGKSANPDLIALVNAGARVDTPALRTVGDNHDPARFNVYGPKVIAGIGELPDTIADRSIPIGMRRKPRGLKLQRVTHADEGVAEGLRRRIVRWADDHRAKLAAVNLDHVRLPESVQGRARDCWEPLAAIAAFAGDAWIRTVSSAAAKLSEARADAETVGIRLLRDVRRCFGDRDKMASIALCHALATMDDDSAPWRSWHRHARSEDERRIQPNDVARLLKPFGVAPHSVRFGSQTAKGYELKDLADALSRYVGEDEPDGAHSTANDPEQSPAPA